MRARLSERIKRTKLLARRLEGGRCAKCVRGAQIARSTFREAKTFAAFELRKDTSRRVHVGRADSKEFRKFRGILYVARNRGKRAAARILERYLRIRFRDLRLKT